MKVLCGGCGEIESDWWWNVGKSLRLKGIVDDGGRGMWREYNIGEIVGGDGIGDDMDEGVVLVKFEGGLRDVVEKCLL